MNNIFDIDDITSVGQFPACRCFLSVSSVFIENCFHFTHSDMSYLIRVVVVWTVITHITYIILIPICLIHIRCDRTVIILIQYTYNVYKMSLKKPTLCACMSAEKTWKALVDAGTKGITIELAYNGEKKFFVHNPW